MTRGEAREHLLREAQAMGSRDGAASRPRLTESHAGRYLVHRAALGAGIGAVRKTDAEAWAPEAVSAYGQGYAEARVTGTRGVGVARGGAVSDATAQLTTARSVAARTLNLASAVGGEPLPDTDQWHHRIEIRSETSSRLYVVAQRKTTGEWACSCMGWKRHRHCKHLSAIAALLGKGGVP